VVCNAVVVVLFVFAEQQQQQDKSFVIKIISKGLLVDPKTGKLISKSRKNKIIDKIRALPTVSEGEFTLYYTFNFYCDIVSKTREG